MRWSFCQTKAFRRKCVGPGHHLSVRISVTDPAPAARIFAPVDIRTDELPAAADVLALYEAVGWSAYTRDPATLEAAIRGSHRVVTAREGARLVGLARTVSDGASICYLQDILVHPSAQGRGVGRLLLDRVLALYPDLRQFVLLTDDDEAQRALYRAAGLVRSDSTGLHAYLRP